MERRRFLGSATLMAGASLLPFSAASLATALPSRWQILWTPDAAPGQAWRPVVQACAAECAEESLQITLDAFHPAKGGGVVRDFGLHAIFDLQGGHSARFTAWQMGGKGALRSESAGSRFVAGRATLRRLEMEYSLGESHRLESLSLVGAQAGLLSPGHYLLVGPRADGSLLDTRGWTHSGNPTQPLLESVEGDVLAFRADVPV